MAYGRVVLASDVGGHQELMDDGVTGRLFEAGNASNLACALLDLLADRSRWRVMTDRARRFVEQERNWGSSVARYENVYRLALAARNGL